MSDQKYRQRGYQDSDRGRSDGPSRGSQSPQSPREKPEGPRGRGLGLPTATVFRCSVCGKKAELEVLTAETSCPHCNADLHTCTHCQHFDPSARWECRQPITVRITGKARRNECPAFGAKQAQEFEAERGGHRDARSAFDALFKF